VEEEEKKKNCCFSHKYHSYALQFGAQRKGRNVVDALRK
jgi:hypothetical protein